MAGRRKADPTVRLSKALSYLLRHGAEKEGFKLKPGGFLFVDEILKHRNFQSASVDDIQHIVENNDKKRFTLETDSETGRLKIRANQGHSLQVDDLDLQPITDAADYPTVIHGTNHNAYRLIAKQGLKPMGRNHVHFAAGEPGENGVISGMRNSCSVVIYLNLHKALEGGLKFYLSANNVILSPGNEESVIPTIYFDKVMDRNTGQRLQIPRPASLATESSADADEDPDSTHHSAGPATVTAEDIADEYDKKKRRKKKGKQKKEDDD